MYSKRSPRKGGFIENISLMRAKNLKEKSIRHGFLKYTLKFLKRKTYFIRDRISELKTKLLKRLNFTKKLLFEIDVWIASNNYSIKRTRNRSDIDNGYYLYPN